MKKRHDIQILRAIAVTAVFLYHLSPLTFTAGYLGVDIFFCLSGYLVIGSLNQLIYKSTKESKKFLFQYWLKRLFRIVPTLAVFVMVGVTFGIFIEPSDHQTQLSIFKEAFTSLFGVYNILLLQKSTNYFRSGSLFLNLWSLSLELQIYIVLIFLAFIAIVITRHGKTPTWNHLTEKSAMSYSPLKSSQPCSKPRSWLKTSASTTTSTNPTQH